MNSRRTSRRDFLVTSLTGAGVVWAATSLPGIEAAAAYVEQAARTGAPAGFAFFTAAQAAEIEAMAAQIIPTGDTPGAREARVVYFIDRALTTFEKGRQEEYRKGLDELALQTKQTFPASDRFSSLNAEQQ